MTEKREIELYKFEELPEKSQEKLVKERQDYNRKHQHPFLDSMMNDWALQELNDINEITDAEIDDIYYSLSYSQGDGVCITGTFTVKVDGWKAVVNVQHNNTRGNYYHKYTMDVKSSELLEIPDDREWEEINIQGHEQDVAETLLTHLMRVCDTIEERGYDELEWWTGEEHAREELKNRDKLYMADGTEVGEE